MGSVRNCEPLGCPFCPQLRFGRRNLLIVNRLLLCNRCARASLDIYTVSRSHSPIGRYPVGLLCIGCDLLCSWCVGRGLRILRSCLLGLPHFSVLGNLLLCTMNDTVSLHIHLMHRFPGNRRNAVAHLICGIFLTGVFRRINAVFRLILGLHIGILHPLSSESATVNGLNGAGYHIPGFDIRHCNLPAL
ncbi:unknown [Firmicutes bacterium CAG:110]|nr:unknown [Firmicutes bacterium CAG:110]